MAMNNRERRIEGLRQHIRKMDRWRSSVWAEATDAIEKDQRDLASLGVAAEPTSTTATADASV